MTIDVKHLPKGSIGTECLVAQVLPNTEWCLATDVDQFGFLDRPKSLHGLRVLMGKFHPHEISENISGTDGEESSVSGYVSISQEVDVSRGWLKRIQLIGEPHSYEEFYLKIFRTTYETKPTLDFRQKSNCPLEVSFGLTKSKYDRLTPFLLMQSRAMITVKFAFAPSKIPGLLIGTEKTAENEREFGLTGSLGVFRYDQDITNPSKHSQKKFPVFETAVGGNLFLTAFADNLQKEDLNSAPKKEKSRLSIFNFLSK